MTACIEATVCDAVLDISNENLSKNKNLALSRVALGTFQILLGVPLVPLQVCVKAFRTRNHLVLGQGIATIKKARSIAQGVFGVIQVIFGSVILPFQLLGRVFPHNQPLLIKKGYRNIFQGVKALRMKGASYFFKVCFLGFPFLAKSMNINNHLFMK